MITLSLLTSSILPIGMLILALLLVSRMRLASMVRIFQLQSLLLAGYAIALAFLINEQQLILVGALVLVVKAVIIPLFLMRVARNSGVTERLSSYVRPTTLTFLGAMLALGAFTLAYSIPALANEFVIVGVSFSLMLLGILSLVARRDMFGQGIGFLVMESGVFTFGLALTHGMPLLVELGALADVLTLFVLIGLLVHRAQGEHSSTATDYLRILTD